MHHSLALVVVALLGACSEDGGTDAGLAPGYPLAEDAEGAKRLLEARVTTAFADAANHESWVCVGGEASVEYRLREATDGGRSGVELDGRGVATDRTFDWAAIGPDSLLLDYPRTGRQSEIASILFADEDAFRASEGESGAIECRRQRYVGGEPLRTVTSVAPDDVDREVEAAASLAARVETRRGDGSDFWFCESDDGASRGYLFAAAGVLAPQTRALAFDAARTGAGASDGSAGIETAPDSARPFRWLATDGTTLVLVPLRADGTVTDGAVGTMTLGGIAFGVDDAFRATDGDGLALQCVRRDLDG